MFWQIVRALNETLTSIKVSIKTFREWFFTGRFKVIRVSGLLGLNGPEVTVLYAGNDSLLPHLKALLFHSKTSCEVLAEAKGHELQKIVQSFFPKNFDLVIMDRLPFNIKKDGVSAVVPPYVEMIIDLPSSADSFLEDIESYNTKRYTKKMLHAGFSFEESTKREDFEYFYHNLFLSLVKVRYLENPIVPEFNEFMASSVKNTLIFITKDSQKLGGSQILWPRIPTSPVRVSRFGISQNVFNDKNLLKMVNLAIYYFSITAAISHGYRKINFGVTPPALNNGILDYKMKWGAKYFLGRNSTRWLFNWKDSERKELFLKHIHLLHLDRNGIEPLK